MNLFLDTSVVLTACGSAKGASRAIFNLAPANGWTLLASPYVLAEVANNLDHFPPSATGDWLLLRQNLSIVDDIVSLDRVVVFAAAKDRPVLFTALAWASVLLTFDHGDFGRMIGENFYGLGIMKPAVFLERERAAGKLNP